MCSLYETASAGSVARTTPMMIISHSFWVFARLLSLTPPTQLTSLSLESPMPSIKACS